MLDAPPKPAGSMRVLVVDDEVNLRFAIERRLRKEDMETASAGTVRQAIEQLRNEAFDVVLCDLRMPGGDGTQLLQWLGSYSPSTRIVVVSAFVTPDFRSLYGPSGLRILEKPVDLDDLVAVLQEFGARKGFYGNAIEVELFDYVQMIAVSGRDKLIEVRTPQGSGLIWFEHGDISHVQYRDFRGETAFYKLLATNRGVFREQFYRPPPMRSVQRSSTHLLMEVARQADEGTLGKTPGDAEVITDEETSFSGLMESEPASESGPDFFIEDDLDTEVFTDEDLEQLVLPADDAEAEASADSSISSMTDHVISDADVEDEGIISDAHSEAHSEAEVSTTGMSMFEDPETRQMLLDQFWQFDGVNGVAIISSTGKVLADDMRSNSALVTLAGFYMRGAARIARDLGYNVFDGIIARSIAGHQMVMVSMGATSAVLSVEIGCDPEAIRDAVLGVE